jgi:hypothetical protein
MFFFITFMYLTPFLWLFEPTACSLNIHAVCTRMYVRKFLVKSCLDDHLIVGDVRGERNMKVPVRRTWKSNFHHIKRIWKRSVLEIIQFSC